MLEFVKMTFKMLHFSHSLIESYFCFLVASKIQ